MTTEPFEALVLKDAEGNYYVFDQAAFERARVPDEHRAELDAQLEDVGGFSFGLPQSPSQGPLSAGLPILGRIGGQAPIIAGFVGPVRGGPYSSGPSIVSNLGPR